MNVIVCLDSKNGMMFNNRRQSRDRVVIDKIFEIIGDANLWIHPYSLPLFEGKNTVVDEDFITKAGMFDYVFVENKDVIQHSEAVNKIIVYRWNKTYPADRYFHESLLINKEKISVKEFKGYSHDVIFEEIYE